MPRKNFWNISDCAVLCSSSAKEQPEHFSRGCCTVHLPSLTLPAGRSPAFACRLSSASSQHCSWEALGITPHSSIMLSPGLLAPFLYQDSAGIPCSIFSHICLTWITHKSVVVQMQPHLSSLLLLTGLKESPSKDLWELAWPWTLSN